ncbi:hypothetical protein IWW50_003433, partial [Coemansia erecta]
MPNGVIDQYDKGQLSTDGTLGHLTTKEAALLQILWRKLLATFSNDASELKDAPAAPPDTAQPTSKRSLRSRLSPSPAPSAKSSSSGSWFG